MPRHVLPLIAAALTLVLGACGSDSSDQASAPSTVTVVEKRVTVTEKEEAAAPADVEDASISEDTSASDAGSSSGKITVPSVVGKDHQLAQDTMQAAGLYNLAEEDATGQGRALIIDRNWTVVSQDPPAGSKVNEDTTITLRSKKDDE